MPGATPTKPGSATLPFFGIRPEVLNAESGKVQQGNGVDGVLVIADSWPGQMRTIWGDHQRFQETYFQQYKGYFFTGDGCRRDQDGYYWITGRVDDVINVSGHRMGTAEVESALVAHADVAEAAVVGYPHEIKGQGIYAYVTLMKGVAPTENLRRDLIMNKPNWIVRQPVDKIYTVPQVIRIVKQAGFELECGIGSNYGPPVFYPLEREWVTKSLNALGLWWLSFHPILVFRKPALVSSAKS